MAWRADDVPRVMCAVTDPELEGDQAAAFRAKLARTGLLDASGSPRPRPGRETVEEARRAADGGCLSGGKVPLALSETGRQQAHPAS